MIISHLEEVEDTKGNSGDSGYLYVTNLRVIWTSASQYRVNLSELLTRLKKIISILLVPPGIGLKTISKIQTKRVKSVGLLLFFFFEVFNKFSCRIFEDYQRQFI